MGPRIGCEHSAVRNTFGRYGPRCNTVFLDGFCLIFNASDDNHLLSKVAHFIIVHEFLFLPLGYIKSKFAAAIQGDRISTTHIYIILSWYYLNASFRNLLSIQSMSSDFILMLQLTVSQLFSLYINLFFYKAHVVARETDVLCQK